MGVGMREGPGGGASSSFAWGAEEEGLPGRRVGDAGGAAEAWRAMFLPASGVIWTSLQRVIPSARCADEGEAAGGQEGGGAAGEGAQAGAGQGGGGGAAGGVAAAAMSDLPPMPEDDVPKSGWFTDVQPPVYDQVKREVMETLRCDTYDGMRFDFTKPLNQVFSVGHSIYMGGQDLGVQQGQMLKCGFANYEFATNLIAGGMLPTAGAPRAILVGRVTPDGRMNARWIQNFDNGSNTHLMMQVSPNPGPQENMGHLDVNFKGSDWTGGLKFAGGGFYNGSYMQSITPTLAVGAEYFWMSERLRSGYGVAVRKTGETPFGDYVLATQLASTGIANIAYQQKVSSKASYAADLTYNYENRNTVCEVGYDYQFRTTRIRGQMDINGTAKACVEEKLSPGLTLSLCGEINHGIKDYKFGFGLQIGE